MDLSPGRRSAPAIFRAGRTTTVESFVSFDICQSIYRKREAILRLSGRMKAWMQRAKRSFSIDNRKLPIANPLHHRLRFGSSFFQNVGWYFLDCHIEFEHRRLAPATPPAHFPVSPQELNLRVPRQVQQQRMLRLVELLRKVRDRLRTPSCAIRRSVNAHVQRLLLADAGDVRSEEHT